MKVNGKDSPKQIIIYYGKLNTCLKPPTSFLLPSGKTNSLLLKMAPVEIVDLPIKHGGSFQFVTLKLPERIPPKH